MRSLFILLFIVATSLTSFQVKAQNSEEDAWIEEGIKLDKEKKHAEARAIFNRIIAKYPNSYRAYNSRGATYFGEKIYDKAIADYSKAVQINPSFTQGYLNRAFVNDVIMNEHRLALADYNIAVAIDTTDFSVLYSRAMVYYACLKELNLAVKDFEQLLRKQPENIGLIVNAFSAYVRLEKMNKAELYYQQFISSAAYPHIKNEDFSLILAGYYQSAKQFYGGETEESLLTIDEVVEKYGAEYGASSMFWDILTLKGRILERLGKTEDAKQIYEQLLAIHKEQPDIIKLLANINRNKKPALADKKGPELDLLTPEPERGLSVISATSLTQVIGKAKDASGIAAVTINGKTVKFEEDGMFVSQLAFKQGINELNIAATDKQGNKSSRKFVIQVKDEKVSENDDVVPVSITNEDAPAFHALIIAADDYADESIQDLQNPVKDAKALQAILQSNYTFDAANIQTVYNKSREEIMQAIVAKCNALKENDNLLIFYAGHGVAEKDKFGEVDGYWIPSTAKKDVTSTYISADDIKKALKRSASKHILIIADACFSGAFTRSLDNASVAVQKQYKLLSRKVMASGNMEPVPDNSMFIYYLKKNLQENREKYLPAKKLFDSFYEALLNNSETTPQYAAIRNTGDEGGEFIFIRR